MTFCPLALTHVRTFCTNTARHLHPQAERVHRQELLVTSMHQSSENTRTISMVISLQVEEHTGFLQEGEMASTVEALTLSTLWGRLLWACNQARSSGRNDKWPSFGLNSCAG